MISVIVCTHNPQDDYFRRVLAALRAQTLPTSEWELLLIDNASPQPLAGIYDLGWHPRGRHVPEPALGLTRARLRGITEAAGDLLIFVDDDNVLAPDYLEQGRAIGQSHPFLGSWGGQILCEFAHAPEPWVTIHYDMLGRRVAQEAWSNLIENSQTAPYGAGLCVRATVARTYQRRIGENPLRLKLGRNGSDLSAAEDIDLVYTGCGMGLGAGVFPRLKLDHLIPPRRMTLEYFVRLASAMAFSQSLLLYIWTGRIHFTEGSGSDRLVQFYRELRQPAPLRAIERARRQGHARAVQFLRSLEVPAPPAPAEEKG